MNSLISIGVLYVYFNHIFGMKYINTYVLQYIIGMQNIKAIVVAKLTLYGQLILDIFFYYILDLRLSWFSFEIGSLSNPNNQNCSNCISFLYLGYLFRNSEFYKFILGGLRLKLYFCQNRQLYFFGWDFVPKFMVQFQKCGFQVQKLNWQFFIFGWYCLPKLVAKFEFGKYSFLVQQLKYYVQNSAVYVYCFFQRVRNFIRGLDFRILVIRMKQSFQKAVPMSIWISEV
eukprot:TRINITY_DN36987_c1_g1_i6.p1 TRINITY_DN36987_c1_g1~~TRINITY_DN36987_c1_g1_i6.p1  ORF type:complete len:229 (-),score=-6.08 TRINITY_DN36987_c1_g1_i6:685-1371(-)